MTVLRVEEMPRRQATVNAQWQRTYTRVWRVTCNDHTDGPVIARAGTDPFTGATIPNIGHAYFVKTGESDNGSFVTEIQVDTEDAGANPDCARYLFTVTYGPYNPLPQDPIAWPLQISWGAQTHEKVITKDITGAPIVNSAGDPFKDPITVDDSRQEMRVSWNVLAYDPDVAAGLRDTLNAAEFAGQAAKCWKCQSLDGELRQNQDAGGGTGTGWYTAVTGVFHLNKDGWNRKLLDQGFSYIDTAGKRATINGDDGQPTHESTLLNGSGGVLAAGGTPTWLDFSVYKTADWSVLGLSFLNAPGQNADENDGTGGFGDGGGGGGGDE